MSILDEVVSCSERSYGDFTYKLIPTIKREDILGLRAPLARKIAKKYAGTKEGAEFLSSLPHRYHDENMVHAFMLGYMGEGSLLFATRFLDYVDNWAVCDSLASGVKALFKDREKMLPYIKGWLKSEQSYRVRFGLVCLLDYYVDREHIDDVLALSCKIKSDEYYINMANAWLISVCLVKEYESTISLIENGAFDIWTHNKAIQKALESYRISKEKKDYLRSLRKK